MIDYARDDPREIMSAALETDDIAEVGRTIQNLLAAHDDFYRLMTRPDSKGRIHAETRHAVDVSDALICALDYHETGAFIGREPALRNAVCQVVRDNAYAIAQDLLLARNDEYDFTASYDGICGCINPSFAMSDTDTRVDTRMTDGVRIAVAIMSLQTYDAPLGFVVKTAYPRHVSGAHTHMMRGVPDDIVRTLGRNAAFLDKPALEQHVLLERCRADTIGSVDFLNHRTPSEARVRRPGSHIYTTTANGLLTCDGTPTTASDVRDSDSASYDILNRLSVVGLDLSIDSDPHRTVADIDGISGLPSDDHAFEL